jgi:hypothetical protein
MAISATVIVSTAGVREDRPSSRIIHDRLMPGSAALDFPGRVR